MPPHGDSVAPSRFPATPTLPRLLNSGAAAEFLAVSPETLATWRCTKRYSILYVKVGRLVKYREADLLAFAESRSVRPRASECDRGKG